MTSRGIAFWGVAIVALSGISRAAAVQDQDTDSLRASYEIQFESFDVNGNGELDEAELDNVPDSDLDDMHAHGLPATIPVSREAFVTSGVATALAAIAGSDNDPKKVMDEKTTRIVAKTDKEEPGKAKPTETKVTGTTAPAASRFPGRKSHFVPELPAEFAARDKNGDGQIALYEWDRKKYSEFAKLDKNGDGFLTPIELLPAEVLKTLYAKVTARTATPVPGTSGTNPAVPGQSGSAGDEVDKEARNVLGQMDQNKNGMIDEDEWNRSTRIRPSFERAGIKVSIPINADTFVQHFRRSKEAERNERR